MALQPPPGGWGCRRRQSPGPSPSWGRLGTSPEWSFQENGAPLSVSVAPRLRMNTNDAVIELALHGWGMAHLLSYQIAPYLADGRLQIVLGDFEGPPVPIHVLHHEGRLVSAKVRSFVDYMAERLRTNPAFR